MTNIQSMKSNVVHYKDSNGHTIIFIEHDSSLDGGYSLSNINSRWFDASYWQHKDDITGQSEGRNTTWFLKAPKRAVADDDAQWVLRHYYRGGLVAKISNDHYIFNGMKKTRAYRELTLLQEMLELGLPVPKPVAARVIKKGFFYSADLLMEKLAAKDLVAILKSETLTPDVWQSIGKTIAQFHQYGIYHADLNAHNIMLDDDFKVYVIDFDRCAKRESSAIAIVNRKQANHWMQQNINRLERSFLKERGLDSTLNFTQQNWQHLLNGYDANLDEN